jgi:hypothetical protein
MECLIKSKAFKEQFPNLIPKEKFINLKEPFEWKDSIFLDCQLANSLHRGGAYGGEYDILESKRIGRDIVEELFGNRYNEILFFYIFGDWSEWHHEFPRFDTFFIIDKRNREILMITKTDVD